MTCLPEMNSALLREAHVLLHLISGFYHITVAHFSRVVFDPPQSKRVLTLSSCTVLLQSI